jgi:hypothetical protein
MQNLRKSSVCRLRVVGKANEREFIASRFSEIRFRLQLKNRENQTDSLPIKLSCTTNYLLNNQSHNHVGFYFHS